MGSGFSTGTQELLNRSLLLRGDTDFGSCGKTTTIADCLSQPRRNRSFSVEAYIESQIDFLSCHKFMLRFSPTIVGGSTLHLQPEDKLGPLSPWSSPF
jgi:hypothetical protein